MSTEENQTTDPAIGREIGSYRVTGVLGKGGMGVVYRAEHPGIGKKVAIKLLNARFSNQQETVMRFFREARAVNDIHHENVIDVLDFGKLPSGECYIIMEHLDGQPLSSAMKNGVRLSVGRIGHILLQVCSALEAAHQKGIVHRDLKPDNIFLITRSAKADFVKLLDFGIAKLLYDDDVPIETSTGAMIGTPMYMSPEQALGRKVDHQSDIYSLGIMLYQMVTGVPPFYDNNPITMAMHHITKEAKPPRELVPELSQALSDVIIKCIAKEKEDRYKTMLELSYALGKACGIDPAPYLALLPSQPLLPAVEAPSAFSTQQTMAPGQTNGSNPSYQPTMGPGGITNQPAQSQAVSAPAETLGASAGEVVRPTQSTKKPTMMFAAGALGAVILGAFAVFGLGILDTSPEPARPAAVQDPPRKKTEPVTLATSVPAATPVAKESSSQATSKPAETTKKEPVSKTKKEPKTTKEEPTKTTTPSLDDDEGITIESLEKKPNK